MDNTEKIIEKIKKVLELSRNNPSEEEAQAAALKAQKLMAEYHISISEIEGLGDTNDIEETSITVGMGNKWKYELANVVSKNFRCKYFIRGKAVICFYGHKVDTEIAAETFKYLFSTGNKTAASYYNRMRNEEMNTYGCFYGAGLKNSFLHGFLNGVSEALDRQCTALMIVVPEEVKEAYAEKFKNSRRFTSHLSVAGGSGGREAFAAGKQHGRSAMESRRLAAGV